MLLQHTLGVNHAFLLTYPDHELTPCQADQFQQLVMQRRNGMPVAYLTGKRAFYDLIFKVTKSVLIPRPETELLVELALERIPSGRLCRILDLGTGSGAIAITIARHRPQSQVVAVDLSMDAISVASWNAWNLAIENVDFIKSHWFDEIPGEKFDLIVSNPPYVAEGDVHLQQGDLRFEPLIALSAGNNGLACIQHIISNAPRHLANHGWLLLEHGYDQSRECKKLFGEKDFSNICSYADLAGIMRVSVGQYGGLV